MVADGPVAEVTGQYLGSLRKDAKAEATFSCEEEKDFQVLGASVKRINGQVVDRAIEANPSSRMKVDILFNISL